MYNPQELRNRAQATIQGVDNEAKTTLNNGSVKPKEKDYFFGERTLATLGHVVNDVLIGATRSLEGIVDAGIMLAGLFGADVDKAVEYDFTGDIFGVDEEGEGYLATGWGRAIESSSIMKEDGFTSQALEGVGGMLPTVLLTILTGGGSTVAQAAGTAGKVAKTAEAAAKTAKVVKAVQTGAFFAQAVGKTSQEALQQGAEYEQALGYGILSGIIESGTEVLGGRVFGEATNMNNSLIGKLLTRKGKTGIVTNKFGKLAFSMLSEGTEEAISELINPGIKRLTGVDKNARVNLKDVAQSFLIGGTVGVVLDEIQNTATALKNKKVGGRNYVDMVENLETIQNSNAAFAVIQGSQKFTQDQVNRASVNNAKMNLKAFENMSRDLTAMSESQRKEALEILKQYSPTIADVFDSNGKLQQDVVGVFDEVIGNEVGKNVSASATHNMPKITEALDLANSEKGYTFELSETNFNEAQRTNFAKVSNAITSFGEKAGVELNLAIINANDNANAFIKDGVVFVSEDKLQDGKWAESVAHEVTHFAENTEEFKHFAEFVTEDQSAVDKAIARIIKARDYGITETDIRRALNKVANGLKLTKAESSAYSELVAHITEDLLGNEESIKRLTRKSPSVARKILNKIKDFINAIRGTNANEEVVSRVEQAEKLFEKALSSIGVEIKRAKEKVRQVSEQYKKDKEEYLALSEDKKAEWLAEKGYKAEDFADDVLDNSEQVDNEEEIRYSYKGKKIARYINKKLDTPTLSFIRNELRKMYGPIDSAIADGIAIEKDNSIYVVDSGMEDGLIDFGVRQQIKIDDDKLRKERLEKINDRAVSNGFSSSEISGRIKRSPDNGSDGSVRRELQKELSDNTRKSQNNERRISEKDATDGSRRLKFSLKIGDDEVSGNIEETKNLVALHNLSEGNLLRVIELGGFPMPSIAVTTTELPHENYGNVTVVFGKETIDPESDYRNVVYDRDAWTPTMPTVDVKLDNDGVDNLVKELQDKVSEQSAFKRSINSFFDGKYRDNNGDYIVPEYEYTKESFGEKAIKNTGIVAAFLNEKGVKVEPVYTERGFTMGWQSLTREQAQSLLDFVGVTKDITRDNVTEEQRKDILEKLVKYKAKEKLGLMRRFTKNKELTVEQVEEILKSEYDDGHVSQLFFMAEDFFNERRPKDIYDEYATIDKMQAEITDKEDFYEWFWEKIQSTFEKKGISNDSDIFDSRGNRRSFEQRHYNFTAANIVRAMTKGEQEGKVPLGMTAGALAAKLSKRFDSIEDIRDAKDYLALVSEEDLKAFNNKTYELYDELVSEIAGRSSDFFADSSRRDDVGEILGKCATAKPLTVENIKRIFNRETKGYNLNYKFNDSIAEKALLLFENLKHIPTTYFESKPRRVVGLKEIKKVLIPKDASENFVKTLDKKKISYVKYEGENARSNILKGLDDIRFSLKESDSKKSRSLTDGQVKKKVADLTRKKVYSKTESEKVINSIIETRLNLDGYDIRVAGKTKAQASDTLWGMLNTLDAGKRTGAALRIADYIIDNAVMESMFLEEENQEHIATISALKPYLHSVDLTSLKGEIKNRYDKDNSVYLLWGKRKGETGYTADQIAMELEEQGVFTKAENEADIFFKMNDAYRGAVKALRTKSESLLSASLTKEEREKLRQDIAKDVLNAFDGGKKSKLADIIDLYRRQALGWKELYYEERKRNKSIDSLMYEVKQLKGLKEFANATQYHSEEFKGSIEQLEKISWRGNYNESGTRKIVANLNSWYRKDNPVVGDRFDTDISEILRYISYGEGKLNAEELRNLSNVVKYFRHFIETASKIYRAGKYVEAEPTVVKYVEQIHENQNLNVGWGAKVFDNMFNHSKGSYMQAFADPMSLARYMDKYEDGFFTETMEEFRKGTMGALVLEMELNAPLEEFYYDNKKYLKELKNRTITYNGVEIPSDIAIYVYMALNREQAIMGLARSGFAFTDKKGNTVRVDGFETNEEVTLEEIRGIANEVQSNLEKQLTEKDLEYIKIIEKIFNEDCKNYKKERDEQRYGFSNIAKDYYIPVRRAYTSKTIDVESQYFGNDRVSNLSFNKSTVKGAKNELWVDPIDEVVARHTKGIAMYYHLSPVIDNYNIIYNMDIGGNPNKVINIKSETANVWNKGNDYYQKLLSDMQGIKNGDGNRFFSWLRGGYAKYQLGANPKVWITQLSSFITSFNILDADIIARAWFMKGSDVDKYCSLAKLRNNDNTAAMAQGVIDNVGKVGDFFMKPIGAMDRFVISKLFAACQLQVARKTGLEVGTEENKVKAGELLTKVILETQQNAMATERSAAMRSSSEFMKTLTMFTSDSMKAVGRVIDAYGEIAILRARKKAATTNEETAKINARLKTAHKKAWRATSSLVLTAAFMAAIAQAFRWLYNKDDEDEDILQNMKVDFIGNLFGGLPIFKEIYGNLAEGYEFNGFAFSSIDDLFSSFSDMIELTGDLFNGKADSRQAALTIKKMSYSIGQIFGLPTRNIYNVVYGLTKRVSPETAYKIDNVFYNQNYNADLKKAIKNNDEDMIATIAGLLMDENVGAFTSGATRKEINRLLAMGFDVLPQSVGDTMTINEVEYKLDEKTKKQFKKVYSQAIDAVDKLVSNNGYKVASDDAKAKAIKYVYRYYYYEAQQKTLNVELDAKLFLFGQIISVETMALALAEIPALVENSKDKKSVIERYLNKARLKAAEKYILMGYLGYKNKNGEGIVKGLVNKTTLTNTQKKLLLEKCGY